MLPDGVSPDVAQVYKILDQVRHVVANIAQHPGRPGGVWGEDLTILTLVNTMSSQSLTEELDTACVPPAGDPRLHPAHIAALSAAPGEGGIGSFISMMTLS